MISSERLIENLSGDLRPVERPRAPALRALAWSAIALVLGFLATRLMRTYWPDWTAPGMGWAATEIALALVMGLGCVVLAFKSSIAGWLPQDQRNATSLIAGLAVGWLTVSVAHILASPAIASYRPGTGVYCFSFMLLAAIPAILLLIVALRRTRSIRPRRTLMLVGTGVAFLAMGLLGFCHPGTLHLADFCAHLLAGLSIGLLTSLFGRVIAA